MTFCPVHNIFADRLVPSSRKKIDLENNPLADIYFKRLYDEKYWLTFHINAEFNFKTEKWNYPTKEDWLQHHVRNLSGCIFPMVVISMLPHAEFGQNDHGEDVLHCNKLETVIRSLNLIGNIAIHTLQIEWL